MPYKLNQDKRHKFDKARYNVKNWPEYDQALKNRGSLTIWFTEEAIKEWQAISNIKSCKRSVFYFFK